MLLVVCPSGCPSDTSIAVENHVTVTSENGETHITCGCGSGLCRPKLRVVGGRCDHCKEEFDAPLTVSIINSSRHLTCGGCEVSFRVGRALPVLTDDRWVCHPTTTNAWPVELYFHGNPRRYRNWREVCEDELKRRREKEEEELEKQRWKEIEEEWEWREREEEEREREEEELERQRWEELEEEWEWREREEEERQREEEELERQRWEELEEDLVWQLREEEERQREEEELEWQREEGWEEWQRLSMP